MVLIFCSRLSSTVSGSADTGLYIIVFLVIIIILRMRRIINGTKISVARTIGFSLYYLIFGALILSGSFFLPIPFEYFVAYPTLFAVSFVLAFEFARRRVVFWKAADGLIYSKGGVPIYLIYIAGLIARIAIGYIYIGPNFLFPIPATTQTLSGAAISATIATDLLLISGVGLLLGRNMRILRKYLAIKSGRETMQPSSDEGESGSLMPA